VNFLVKKEKLVCIIGPTAVGKTKLSIDLAKRFDAEIISGDSMQIYRGMDIGTAKITKEEMSNIPHHLIDIKNPDEPFSAFDFQQLVRKKIMEISNRNHLPMIVGGTGLYIQSVIFDYQFSDSGKNEKIRTRLEEKVKNDGIEPLYQQLLSIDPETAGQIHPNNERRVIRALEVYYSTGMTMTELKTKQEKQLLYDVALVGLTMDREKLYKRINDRVDQMIENGLLEEAKAFYNQGLKDVQSTQAIGYKELFAYFDGEISLEKAIDDLKKNTRHFAKRQLTWFRNKMDVQWFDVTNEHEYEKNLQKISDFIAGKLQLRANT
jgi:tRNA dimethylallyltransferase